MSGAPVSSSPEAAAAWRRCFIALAPDDASRAALAALPLPPSARRVPIGQLHMTVVFIGALSAAQGEALAGQLHTHAAPLDVVRVDGIECWPGRARPRLMVATLAMSGQFVALDWRVRSSMAALGLPLDARAFRPHVTLARFAREASAVQIATDVSELPELRFTSLVLYSSTLARQGSRYDALASVALT